MVGERLVVFQVFSGEFPRVSTVNLAYSAYSSSTGAAMAREKRERDGSKDGMPEEKRPRPQLARFVHFHAAFLFGTTER